MKKRYLPLFVATLATLFITLTASAQGEWKWAHYWSGNGNNIFNKVINTAFDEEGNIYVYGTAGSSPVMDGTPFQFINNPQVLGQNSRSVLLTKYDTLGNLLWYKVIKSSSDNGTLPTWMEVRDNKIHISGNLSVGYVDDIATVNNVWLYYLDTLVTGTQIQSIPTADRTLPFRTGRYTYFITLDLDGNLLENHFVEAFSRQIYSDGNQAWEYLCGGLAESPIHVDLEGNTYVYTQLIYFGEETNPYTIIVDGDTNRKYDIFLEGNADSYSGVASLSNGMIYKFSPTWELLFVKKLVDHTVGVVASQEHTGDSVTPRFYPYLHGLSYDESDNMYLTGYVELAMYMNGMGGELHQYPAYVYWDSTHFAAIHDITSAEYCNFVIKYNTYGEVVWSNQIHTRGEDISGDPDKYARSAWFSNSYNENAVYVLGWGEYGTHEEALIYFDNESDSLKRFQPERSTICFFAKFNAATGCYESHGIVPAQTAMCGKKPSAIFNRVMAFSTINNTNRTICQWRDDGLFIQSYAVGTSATLENTSVALNNNGYCLASMTANASVSFGNGVSVGSGAVFALYHDPEFAQPFVPDDSVGIDEYYQNREREIYLYPNPTDGQTTVCGYMYGYRSIELLDLQGRKLATLLDSPHGTSLPEIDLSPYPSGTYLVKINFERGVSVVRKAVRM